MSTKLGQNFLVNKKIVSKIIEAADLKPTDYAIEVGPGRGALSYELKNKINKFIMIEKDSGLAAELARNLQFPIYNFQTISKEQIFKFKNEYGIISGDILNINLEKLIKENNFQKYKIIANLPYYITSAIIRKFLETDNPPREMILMVQKEVAERIVAQPGKMSTLSVSVQYYARPEILFYVGKENFSPMPEVDSAVIKIIPFNLISSPSPSKGEGGVDDKKFFQIVRAGFSARRKMLVNNLANSFHMDKKHVEEKLKKAGISPATRAQELSMENWKKLAEIF